MAIFESAAFTRLRNSFGNLTTYFSRGKNILRIKTTTVRNPRTLEQQVQRARLAALVELSKGFRSALLVGFPGRPVEETPYNTFVRLNADAVTVDESLEVTVDYAALVCSQGSRRVPDVTVSDAGSGSLQFSSLAETYGADAAADDTVYAVLYEKSLNESVAQALGMRGEENQMLVELPEGWSAENVEAYCFALAAKGRIASGTKYLTIQSGI